MNRRHFLRTAVAAGAGASLARFAFADSPKGGTVNGSTAFACDLYGKLRSQPGNLFFSPLSISAALTMTSAGAAGATLDEMVKVLHLPADQTAAHAAAVELTKALTAGAAAGGYELMIANALWAQQGFAFKDAFLATLKTSYGAAPERVDFAANPEAARKAINAWVERQTKDKIKDLFPPGIIDGLTRLVLANAVYFKGDWLRQFTAGSTVDQPFVGTGGSVKVPMMHQTDQLRYAEGEGWQSLGMGYKGDKLEMVFVLPRAADGLGKLEEKLTADTLASYVGGLKPERVAVSLPRFKATAEFNLNKTLASLGMARAFSQTEADFSRMTAGDPLYIQAVVHKAYVDVNEKGSEAAAATGVAIGVRSAAPPPTPPKVFKADHPFLFLIRDRASGAVLFLGRYAKP